MSRAQEHHPRTFNGQLQNGQPSGLPQGMPNFEALQNNPMAMAQAQAQLRANAEASGANGSAGQAGFAGMPSGSQRQLDMLIQQQRQNNTQQVLQKAQQQLQSQAQQMSGQAQQQTPQQPAGQQHPFTAQQLQAAHLQQLHLSKQANPMQQFGQNGQQQQQQLQGVLNAAEEQLQAGPNGSLDPSLSQKQELVRRMMTATEHELKLKAMELSKRLKDWQTQELQLQASGQANTPEGEMQLQKLRQSAAQTTMFINGIVEAIRLKNTGFNPGMTPALGNGRPGSGMGGVPGPQQNANGGMQNAK